MKCIDVMSRRGGRVRITRARLGRSSVKCNVMCEANVMFKCNVQMLSDVMFKCNVQMLSDVMFKCNVMCEANVMFKCNVMCECEANVMFKCNVQMLSDVEVGLGNARRRFKERSDRARRQRGRPATKRKIIRA